MDAAGHKVYGITVVQELSKQQHGLFVEGSEGLGLSDDY